MMVDTVGDTYSSSTETLCSLLLDAIGRSSVRMDTARRHVAILDAATPYMTLAQRQDARRRIARLETRWGPLLPGIENMTESEGIPPISRVARWLSTRRQRARLLNVLHRAAVSIAGGATRLLDVSDHAFARETDFIVSPVGYDSFKEWLIELRLARKVGRGLYEPGALCDWFVEMLVFSKDKSSPYQVCLATADEIRQRGRFRMFDRQVATTNDLKQA